MASAPSRLPESFLRGLEADLRALCADARRKSPHVKDVAEKVILSLKQADTPALEARAADEAVAAFCVACELPSSSSGAPQASQIKVVVRAVSSLHKLLTHRAVSTETLPQILDALQRLANTCVDDTVTLKVLQGLLSLLTVRTYAQSLSEDQLACAFSLLFILKTSRSVVNSNPATNALSAISQQMVPSTDSGVIEQTSKAAFRQVSSDLFAVAADAAVQTAVRMKMPSGEHIPLSEFPSEARAAHSLLTDLCHAASGEPLLWLSSPKTGQANASTSSVLDLALALEVIDDGLASNIALFAAQPVFSQVLTDYLCPTIQKLLKTPTDKQTSKSLFGLVVTVLRNYWRILQADAVALLKAVQASCDPALMSESDQRAWSVVYAMEALRNVFTSKSNEPNIIVDFVKTFDLNNNAGKSIAGVVDVASMAMISASQNEIKGLPPAPVTGAMKPFGKSMTNTTAFLVASATGLYVEIVEAMSGAVQGDQIDAAKEILSAPSTDRVISFIGKLLATNTFADPASSPRPSDPKKAGPTECLARALCSLTIAGELCGMQRIREKSLATLAAACVSSANFAPPTSSASKLARRMYVLYNALFIVISSCRQSLGPSWPPIVEALEKLDTLIIKEEMMVDRQSNKEPESLISLKAKLKSVFVETESFKWEACHEMISALVQSSRQSMIAVSKRVNNEDVSKADIDPDVRIFGIASAETAILSALKAATVSSEVIPTTLWQLLTGHLTSVCSDSPVLSLRLFGLNSLTRIACGAVTTVEPPIVGHDKIVTPFLDLFNSSHSDVRSGSLSALHTVLESQGEHLRGEAAWRVVLDVLTTAAGPKHGKTSRDLPRETSSSTLAPKSPNQPTVRPEMDMVSEGFKVVQVIADDFLSSLATNSLPTWVRVLGLYCKQHEDVNVALTAIGLLWRTADFIAKSSGDITEDGVWVEVFQILKEVSMDERPEIRNCAVKTLTGALSAHSSRLTAKAWSECAKKALLPLLEDVMQGGSMASQPDEHVSSRNRGDVQVMLHHSRDTPRKQWNETKVLALDGVAKVLRSAMPRLAALKDSDGRPLFLMLTDGGANGLWMKMLRAAGVAAASRDGEVAIAGVSAILELLSAAGFVVEDTKHVSVSPSESGESTTVVGSNETDAPSKTASKSWMSEVMSVMDTQSNEAPLGVPTQNGSRPREDSTVLLWEDVWSALAEAVGGTELIPVQQDENSAKRAESKIVDEKALQILAEGLIDARRKLRKKFTVESSKLLVKVLMYLALGGSNESSRENGEVKHLSVIQESVLKGFNELSFGEDIESWNAFIQGLLGVLPTRNTRGHKNPLLSRRVLEVLSTLYASDDMPAAVKRGQLLVALPVLRKLMVPGRVPPSVDASGRRGPRVSSEIAVSKNDSDAPMWALATQVVLEMMSLGWSSGSGRHADAEWILFADIATEFLYEERRTHLDRDLRRGERGIPGQEVFDMKIVSCVTDGLKDMDSSTSIDTQRRLLRIISRGAEEGEFSGRRRFVRTCQKKLFLLGEANEPESSDGTKVGGIASECGHYVVETCARVLGQYVADVQRAGRCPLPAGRRAEAVFLLQQLRRMLRRSESGGRSPASRKHVLALYPRLCECVESRDEAIRHLARELLDETSPLVSDGSLDVEAAMRRRRALA